MFVPVRGKGRNPKQNQWMGGTNEMGAGTGMMGPMMGREWQVYDSYSYYDARGPATTATMAGPMTAIWRLGKPWCLCSAPSLDNNVCIILNQPLLPTSGCCSHKSNGKNNVDSFHITLLIFHFPLLLKMSEGWTIWITNDRKWILWGFYCVRRMECSNIWMSSKF